MQNDDLIQQNEILQKHILVLRRKAGKNVTLNKKSTKNDKNDAYDLIDDEETKQLIKELDSMNIEEEEKNMQPADLLLHRFAAVEANDFRLSPEQRMKKTAKMMTDLSGDINDLMTTWLPKNKVKSDRKTSKALVFQVRQLIGHFNVLVQQMKQNEASYQNDLKLDIKRRDAEIKRLKEENKTVHQFQDDLAEKDDIIERLRKEKDEIEFERDQFKSQTQEQQDMIFDVQNQVKYLNNELEKNRSTILEMKRKSKNFSANNNNDGNNNTNNPLGIDFGALPDYEDEESEYSDDDIDQKDNNDNNNGIGQIGKKKKQRLTRRKSTMTSWRENLQIGDQLDCQDESGLWWTARIVNYKGSDSNMLQVRYDGWGDQYDEVIPRDSPRIAVYKSRYHTKKGGKKIIREGVMQKEGKMFKTWRKRYFTLDDTGTMSYYQNKGDQNPIGSFDVKLMKKTERASFGRNKQFGISIHTENRLWKFLCESEKDLAEWIHAINFVKRGQFDE